VATAIALYGPGSGAALATVVGVLVEVPVMLSVCAFCNVREAGSVRRWSRWRREKRTYSRVLFATDLSEASDLALDCVAGWKDSVCPRSRFARPRHPLRGRAAGLEERLRSDHAPKLERQAQRVRDAGIMASWRLEFGVPYLDIERIAREEGAEAVVLGSHGASWIRRSGSARSRTRSSVTSRCR